MIRIVLILLPFSLLLFAYPAWRLGHWFGLPPGLNLAIVTPLFLSQYIARIGLRHCHGRLAFVLRGAADFFLGLSPILLIQVLGAELLLLLFDWPGSAVAAAIVSGTALLALWGLRRAWRPEVVTVTLRSSKLARAWRFVQISDVHIGSRTTRFLAQVVDQVAALRPDFVCITGDFIDQPGLESRQLAVLERLACPIYYCTGNHERYEDLEKIVERLQGLGLEVLRNRAVEVDGLQILGIEDSDDPQQVAKVLPFLPLLPDRYAILLYHRPQGLQAARKHGIDLMLSGHTHAGQIVPFHLAVNKVYDYTQGLYREGDTALYVNEGTGTWGPTLRLGTRSEITLFEVSPGSLPGAGELG